MTHGRAAYSRHDAEGLLEEGLEDVRAPGGRTIMQQIGNPAYGWMKARKVAAEGGALGTPMGADNNADTLALFGVSTYPFLHRALELNLKMNSAICILMDDPQNSQTVDDDGNIIPLR